MYSEQTQKAIYMGVPIKLLPSNHDGGVLSIGPMGWILDHLFRLGLPFNGEFYFYDGNYFIALWYWMFDNDVE